MSSNSLSAQAPLRNRATAYSYLRFSSPEQSKGDSLRRQTDAAQAYAERNGLDLDTQLTFHDLGISAFRGANVANGALGAFLRAVEERKAKPNSYLLVESLDRVTRQNPWDALPIFQQIINAGVSIVTLQDGRTYSKAEIQENPFRIMESLFVMIRANEESEVKSRRLQSAWQNKRDKAVNGHKLTKMAPAWLQLEDGQFHLIEERAAIVRRIFDMTVAGYGYVSIARIFNAEGIETFHVPNRKKSDGWHHSYVVKILNNPAVIGKFQPMKRVAVNGAITKVADGDVIDGYFPAIIDETVFYRVKRSKPGTSPRKGQLSNLLSGLVFCSVCGGKMHFISKGPLPKGGTYLACDNARRKKTCSARSVRYDPVFNMVLYSLSDEIDVASLIDLSRQPTKKEQLQHHKERLEAQIEEASSAIDNLLDVLSRGPSMAIEERLAKLEAHSGMAKQLLVTVEEQLIEVSNHAYEGAVEAIDKFREVMSSGDASAIGEVRIRLNAALKKVISRVEVGWEDEYTWSITYNELGKFDDSPQIVVSISFHEVDRPLVLLSFPTSVKPLKTWWC